MVSNIHAAVPGTFSACGEGNHVTSVECEGYHCVAQILQVAIVRGREVELTDNTLTTHDILGQRDNGSTIQEDGNAAVAVLGCLAAVDGDVFQIIRGGRWGDVVENQPRGFAAKVDSRGALNGSLVRRNVNVHAVRTVDVQVAYKTVVHLMNSLSIGVCL